MGTGRALLISRMPGACKNERVRGCRASGRKAAALPAPSSRGAAGGRDLTPPVGVVTVSPVLRRPRERSKRALARGAVVFTLATLTAGGCGPIEYLNQVSSKAATAVVAAKRAEADRYAPYEYTAAEQYLHKAREEAGYAEYQDAIEYGHKAEDLAKRARAIALNRFNQPAAGEAAPPLVPAPAPAPSPPPPAGSEPPPSSSPEAAPPPSSPPARSRSGRKAKRAPAPGTDDEEPHTIQPLPGSSKSPGSE
jgi:hypothetical protein